MLLEKTNRFWKAGLIERNKKTLLFAMIILILPIMTGGSDETPEVSDIEITWQDGEVYSSDDNASVDVQHMEELLSDIYDEAVVTNTLGSLDIMRRMVARLGENGYVAVDSGNQVDMTQAEQAVDFCKAVDEKKMDELTIIVVMEMGIRKFDLKTEDGSVNIVRGYYQYDQNGSLQNRSTVSYPADFWQYTEEGYLIFKGSYFSNESYILTLSGTPEHTMLRILPLDEKCREYNRKYILPVGYEQNNLFLCNWSEDDFGDLDFYDLFDRFYPMMHSQPVPYMADENLGVGAVYQVPEELFEDVIGAYFNIGCETLRSKTTYILELAAYEYRPRGFYEAEYPDIAYPEVVSYTQNEDGTVTLHINAVYPNGNMFKEFSHITVIRSLSEDSFQYVSNEIVLPEGDHEIWWHSNRLTEEEWKEVYGGDGS
ncbi:MAG: short-chain isoprenyl diphosphate synthase [Lachnospiraceae bacterium]|nr:short-chain isoprenyl diphosphate synthase [Lachnospiraceae bacterium]